MVEVFKFDKIFKHDKKIKNPQDNDEIILCAACLYKNRIKYISQPSNIKDGIVTLGYRHGEAIKMMDLLFPNIKWCENSVQGFLSSKNRFLTRVEAMQIAYKAKQVEELGCALISEDLY